MATNLEIDNELIQEALKLGGHRTKRAVVEAALQEYVQRHKQLKITELLGTEAQGNTGHDNLVNF